MRTRIEYEPVSIIPGRGKRDSKIGALEWNAIGVNTEPQALQHLTVLKLREFDQNLAGRMLDLKLLKNGCAVIRDGDVANIVHQHLVQPRWPERAATVLRWVDPSHPFQVSIDRDSHERTSSRRWTQPAPL